MPEYLEPLKYYLPFFGLLLVGYLVWLIYFTKKRKKLKTNYLAQYPDAAQVFLTTKALITSEAVSVHLVNGEEPAMFTLKGKSGFYVKPGENEVNLSYTYTRPGVMYKTVTKTYGPVNQTIEVEPQGNYLLDFDRKESEFLFQEYQPKK